MLEDPLLKQEVQNLNPISAGTQRSFTGSITEIMGPVFTCSVPATDGAEPVVTNMAGAISSGTAASENMAAGFITRPGT